ncbi:MAG: hypothetical protein L0K84_04780 [Acidipropionibacterium jensenii]|nr:hypothetical protein [Acidipropionibacterium jensenii]
MTWADPGAWYIGAAYLVALVALAVLAWSATRQWRSRRAQLAGGRAQPAGPR